MKNIYQLRIQLEYINKPPIWREIHVIDLTSLYLIHCTIQGAMGWFNCHLHQFIQGNQFYGIPHPDYGDSMADARKIPINKVLQKEKDWLHYEYDFGDGWMHRITLEKISQPVAGKEYPLLIKGKGACPPEDCGGPPGYENMKEIIADPNHEEHEEMVDWLGDDFDPNEFDLLQHQNAMAASYKSGLLNKGKEFNE